MSDKMTRAELIAALPDLRTGLERLNAQIAESEQALSDGKEAVSASARTTNGLSYDLESLIKGYHALLIEHTPKLAELRTQADQVQRLIWMAEDSTEGA